HVSVLMLDLAGWPEHERGADDAFVFLAVVLLLAPRTELLGQAMVRVRKQWERLPFLLLELGVRLRRVRAHPHAFVAGGEELVVGVPKVTCFRSTAARHGLRIEEDDQPEPAELA